MSTSQLLPATEAVAITPGTPYAKARAIYVGVTGNIVLTVNGSNITFTGAVAGSVIPIYSTNVVVSGTTATDMVALY